MACIIPRRIINRRYVKIAKENNEDVDQYSNREDYYVDVPCGRCINCLNSYMTKWRTRLFHEYEYMSTEQRRNSYFITLTFRNDVLYKKDFDVYKCKYKFIDRLRKSVGSTPRYFLITEYGDQTLRLHLHGIIFDCNFPIHELGKYWTYGFVDYEYLTDTRIKYITSYITKYSDDVIINPKYIQRVFCSPGLGKKYTEDKDNIRYHHPADGVLNPILQNSTQHLIAMPRYYRNKIFTDDEREDMSIAFFAEQSDDVIPPPPYKIGKRTFTDYTLYLQECKKYKSTFNKLYVQPKKLKNYGIQSQEPLEFSL